MQRLCDKYNRAIDSIHQLVGGASLSTVHSPVRLLGTGSRSPRAVNLLLPVKRWGEWLAWRGRGVGWQDIKTQMAPAGLLKWLLGLLLLHRPLRLCPSLCEAAFLCSAAGHSPEPLLCLLWESALSRSQQSCRKPCFAGCLSGQAGCRQQSVDHIGCELSRRHRGL